MSSSIDNKTMRLLAIDGGGIKGAYAAAFLTGLETYYKSKPLHEVFDLIAGTSTGSLIALALGAGKSAGDMVRFYREHGPRVFPPQQYKKRFGQWRKYRAQIVRGHCYSQTPLRRALEDVYGTLQMRDAKTKLCIPAVRVTDCKPKVFKTSTASHLTHDQTISMVDVGLATSAAPSFFPICRVSEPNQTVPYVDGGLWANNPSLVALSEALNYYVGPDKEFQSVSLLSIGLPSQAGYLDKSTYTKYKWPLDELMTMVMESNKCGADFMTGFLMNSVRGHYYRVQPDPLGVEQARLMTLDNASPENIGALTQLGETKALYIRETQDISRFFV